MTSNEARVVYLYLSLMAARLEMSSCVLISGYLRKVRF